MIIVLFVLQHLNISITQNKNLKTLLIIEIVVISPTYFDDYSNCREKAKEKKLRKATLKTAN